MLPGVSKEPAFEEDVRAMAVEPFAAFLFTGPQWLEVLDRGSKGAGGVVAEMQRLSSSLPADTRRSVIVSGLGEAIKRRPGFTQQRVDGMHATLYVAGGVDVRAVDRLADVGVEVTRMTRVIAQTPYERAPTALACVSREKGAGTRESSGSTRSWAGTWSGMLAQVNGMSTQKAGWVVAAYPTFRSLMEAYGDEERGQKGNEGLLADVMHEAQVREGGEGKKPKRFAKVSREVYRFFTTEDPELVIGQGSE
jgi:hypothetical protein